ncbi:transposase [Gloeomargaritales cyanobacterium VI4D9]|nr:transposase [Gloeomargaritales cyanobacterium VI4D9]
MSNRIAQLQKQLARRVKGFHRWERTRLRIAKLHCRIEDLRTDFLHKLSTKLTHKNQVVVLEDLNVRGMLKNRKLSKAISRQGWYLSAPCVEARLRSSSGKYASLTVGKPQASTALSVVGTGVNLTSPPAFWSVTIALQPTAGTKMLPEMGQSATRQQS